MSQTQAVESTEELVVTQTIAEVPLSRRHRYVTGSVYVLFGLICVFALGFGSRPGDSAFDLSQPGDRFQIPTLRVPAVQTAVAFGIVIVLIGIGQLVVGYSRRQQRWALTAAVVLFALAFLVWAASGDPLSLSVRGMVVNTIIAAVPLVLGALCGIIGERSGVINVAIEGQMLVGAFFGVLAASAAHTNAIGILAAMIGGGLLGLMLAVFAIKYLVNQVVLGVVLNTFALGLTNLGYHSILSQNPSLNSPSVLQPIRIPVLADIPVIGPAFFNVNVIVYATYFAVLAVQLGLFRTRWGLRTRAVGEHPKAADTVGINVNRTRYRNLVIAGLLAGLAGAFLTIGNTGGFNANDMAGGRGFIALAAVIFGRWSPGGAVAAALLFGFTDQLQTSLTVVTPPVAIPSSILGMAPYVATIIAVAGLVGRVNAPAADGEPYVKE